MSRENVEVVRVIYDEWSRGNMHAGADLYDESILVIPPRDLPEAGPLLGLEKARRWMRRWLEEWNDFTIVAEDLIEAGDSVVVVARQAGKGSSSGIAADLRYFAVWTFRGGKVIRMEQFLDRDEAMEAVGLQ